MSAPATEPTSESTRIQAAVLDGNGTISIEHVDLAAPGPGEVRVRIAAAGVCHSDLHVTTGAWDVPAPVVLGHEGSGVVTAVGADVDDLEPGDHVVLSWVPGCGECRACQACRPAQCSLVASVVATGGTLYDGTTRLSNERGQIHHYLGVSSYAEQVVVPAAARSRSARMRHWKTSRSWAVRSPPEWVRCAIPPTYNLIRPSR